MTRFIGVFLLLFASTVHAQTMSAKAKSAFANVGTCDCTNCTCKDCQCKNGDCKCKDCGVNLEAAYAKSIKDGQIIVIEVGGVVPLKNTPWRIIKMKSLPGEVAGYIVGVPKDGVLHRLDFGVYHTRENIRMGILHLIYPLTPGYSECPNCPTGRIWTGRAMSSLQFNCTT